MVLIDTHVLIWMTQPTKPLTKAARTLLASEGEQGGIGVADICLREIAFLVSARRVAVNTALTPYLKFIESNFTIFPITSAIAERSVTFGRNYPNDPVDQLVGATAVIHGLRLVTADRAIRRSGEVDCVW